jgi:flagellar biosynthesis/type III secretory pathway M-ring protein FliF/YscJ
MKDSVVNFYTSKPAIAWSITGILILALVYVIYKLIKARKTKKEKEAAAEAEATEGFTGSSAPAQSTLMESAKANRARNNA